MRTAALRVAELGLRVHPLIGKRPIWEDWPSKATSERAEVMRMMEPGRNYGIVCDRVAVTPGAIRVYTRAEIDRCLATLQAAASEAGGLGYAQAFDSDERAEPLWFIEDAGEGAITALLPSEY
jgi:hypothetical protein